MTLEEYYIAEDKIVAPTTMSLAERINFYKEEVEKLRSQLSPEILEKVLENERHWEDKMQSGASMPVIVED